MKTTKMLAARHARDARTAAPASRPAGLKKLGEQKDVGDYRREAAKRASGAKVAEEKPVIAPAKSDVNGMAARAEAEERKALDRQLARIARKRIIDRQSKERLEKQQEAEERVKVDLSTVDQALGAEASGGRHSPWMGF